LRTGRTELTPDLLGDFAVLLTIPADELEALTGLAPRGMANLEVGGLTHDQVRHLREFGRPPNSMLSG
jgi:hypothetical protein